jgi:SAM-dependent methyltransferase
VEIYRNPLYYEIAFSFFDVKKQVDTFELIIREFSKITVRRFLDVACGPSLQLREIARRGYEAVGLDIVPEMLDYLSRKAKMEGLRIEMVEADMCNFRLRKKADFAFIMMGSLVVESDEKLLSHLNSVARSLNDGGLYLIQNKAVDWTLAEEQSWSVEKEGIIVKTTFKTHWKDILNQIYAEEIKLEVDDRGRKTEFETKEDLKFVFPQEFKTLVRLNGKFEFLGWWEGNESTWLLDKPLENAQTPSNYNIVILRRR